MKHIIITSVAILAMSAAPAWSRGERQAKTAKPISDQEFVMNAAEANIAEIDLGTLAQAKALSTDVKTFGKRMVDDHQKALDRLKTVATSEKITLPTHLDSKDQSLKDRLETLSGAAFDRAYMNAMVRDHRQDVANFRAEMKDAKVADVKQYATATLPTLEEHLRLAQSTDKSVNAGASKSEKKRIG
jgi:putative membrane protein